MCVKRKMTIWPLFKSFCPNCTTNVFSKDYVNITLHVFKFSDCITLRLSFCAFFVLSQVHRTTYSCSLVRYSLPLSTSDPHKDCDWKGLGIKNKIRFRRTQGQVTSKPHGQPCKINCSGHSFMGGGGSQPEQPILVTSFGGTKVWVFVFLKAD